MPRIPEEEIERLKRDTDLIALIQSRGVALKRQGANWSGLCPFHEDKQTPNLIVTPGKGLWRCMASQCGKAGNAIQFVQHFDGLSFRHAFELLAHGGQRAFERPPNGSTQPKKSYTTRLPSPIDLGDQNEAGSGKETGEGQEKPDGEILAQVARYYHERLPLNPDALAYLQSRGLGAPELIQRFQIGFADRSLGLRLPLKQNKQGAAIRARLAGLGVYRKKTGHEHLNGCVVVPVLDPETRQPAQLYGRRIDPKAPKDKRHLYLARPQLGIFNPDALKQREIILCESILDALTFIAHGMEATTCTFGSGNLPAHLLEAIQQTGVESVRLAFDADQSGEAASTKAASALQALGIQCFQVKLPWGSDPNQYAQDQGGEALRQAVRNAVWLGEEVPKAAPLKDRTPSKTEKGEATKAPQDQSRTPSSLAACLAAKGKDAGDKEGEGNAPTPSPEAPTGPAASASPPAPALHAVGDHLHLTLATPARHYRITGLERNAGLESLKITLRLTFEDQSGPLFHLDTLDLCRDTERRRFIERAAEETRLEKPLIKRDLGRLLLLLETHQENRLNPDPDQAQAQPIPQLTPEEHKEALHLLQSPDLLAKLAQAFQQSGIVGEETNALTIALACTSRLLNKPLAVIIQSTSAAGKSTLMEAALALFPPETQVKYSAMTGQSLYYLGETNLAHKILAIAEEEGAEKASYALKLLQSEGKLTIASTGKDPHTGRMETQEYHVEGPCTIILTTTSIDIDEELKNRCLILTVDESKEQTQRIHQIQRQARTSAGLEAQQQRETARTLLQNAQRLLKPCTVANDYANQLTFAEESTRTRRDHEKYLTLIETIAFLHQYQRQLNSRGHLPVTKEDIQAANQIAQEVLARSLDELPPQTRNLLEHIKALVRERLAERTREGDDTGEDDAPKQPDQRHIHFTRKDLRERIGWSVTQTRIHLERLVELEYIQPRHGRNGISFRYELLIDAHEPEGISHIGLIDPEKLRDEEPENPEDDPPATPTT